MLKPTTILNFIFGFGFMFYMSAGYIASAQVRPTEFDQMRATVIDNAADIRVLKSEVARNSRDIELGTKTMNDLAEAINNFSGIGIGISALGGVIVILQSVNLLKKSKGTP